VLRAARLRLAVASYVARKLGPPLAGIAAYTIVAAWLVRWDLARAGQPAQDFEATAYALFTQIFFEPTAALPATHLARAIFWLTPAVGVFLAAEGIMKAGASLLDIARRREVWMRIVTAQMRGHVVVCGLGHVGYRVVEELRRLGEDVVAIERRPDAPFLEVVRAEGVPVLVGDARRDDLLEATGIARAKAIVCATNDDLANLELALDAKHVNPGVRVVMRMFDQRLAGKVGGALELDASFSTSALAASLVAVRATQDRVLAAYRIGETVRVTAEVRVGPGGAATTIGATERAVACRVIGLRHAEGVFSPANAEHALAEGDVLVIDVTAEDLPSVRRRLEA
jgi:Trk K+ transport system NAD-binding subunit